MLPIEGQNDGALDDLLITPQEFESWVQRHRAALQLAMQLQGAAEAKGGAGAELGVPLVAEGNQDMQGSYAMLDAGCR